MLAQQQINDAVTILRSGGLVAFPTETVYGLGADARNPLALAKIFAAKGRPADHPLIVHIAAVAQLTAWASDIPEVAYQLAQAFWPGPMTLILKKAGQVDDLITGGQETIALRVPSHPVARALLQSFNGALAAPSANRFGRISPTTAAAVVEELGASVDLVLEGGQCEVGVESTIVDISTGSAVILRPGMISAADIAAVLGYPVAIQAASATRVSGSHESHYAPRTTTVLIPATTIVRTLSEISAADLPGVVLHRSELNLQIPDCEFVKLPADAKSYAHDLYATLRLADQKNVKNIFIESVPDEVEWDAVRDRLMRASKLYK
jgi:L-threonylcarbamoyladenylate synthase